VALKHYVSLALFLIGLAAAAYYACMSKHGIFACYRLRKACAKRERRIGKVTREIAWLKQENKEWQENPFKKEAFARLELGMGYTNELVYQVK